MKNQSLLAPKNTSFDTGYDTSIQSPRSIEHFMSEESLLLKNNSSLNQTSDLDTTAVPPQNQYKSLKNDDQTRISENQDEEQQYEYNQDDLKFIQTKHNFFKRFKQIVKLSFPIAASQLLEIALQFINIVYAGHLDSSYTLAAMGLSITVINILGHSLLNGIASGFDTLGPQSFGAGNYNLFARYFNRAFIIQLILGVLIFPLFYFISDILVGIGIMRDVAELTGEYLIIVYPGMLFEAIFILMKKSFRAQRIIWPQFLPNLIILPFHIMMCQLFTFNAGMGYRGIAFAMLISYIGQFLLALLFMQNFKYCKFVKQRQTVQFFTKEDFKKWGEYLKIAVPALILTIVEWWSFELSTFLCSFISVQALSAQVILMNLCLMLYLISMGFCNTAASLVGNAIGMNQPDLAKKLARQSVFIAFSFIVVITIICACLKKYIIMAFTDQDSIIQQLNGIYYFGLIAITLDSIQNTENGILRGLSELLWPSVSSLLVYYAFHQPLSISLAFAADMGVQGIWVVVPFTLTLNGTLYFILIKRVNFVALAAKKFKELRDKEKKKQSVKEEETQIELNQIKNDDEDNMEPSYAPLLENNRLSGQQN